MPIPPLSFWAFWALLALFYVFCLSYFFGLLGKQGRSATMNHSLGKRLEQYTAKRSHEVLIVTVQMKESQTKLPSSKAFLAPDAPNRV